MKLTDELKNRIDQYFEHISPEYLFEISVKNYKFSEITFELENESFTKIVEFDRPLGNTNLLKESIKYNISDNLACAA